VWPSGEVCIMVFLHLYQCMLESEFFVNTWKGDVQLERLSLKADALKNLHMPVTLKGS
jgi:hypothetical protein